MLSQRLLLPLLPALALSLQPPALSAQEVAQPGGVEDVVGFLHQVHAFLEPAEGAHTRPVSFELHCTEAAGSAKFLKGQTVQITAQSLDRVKLSAEIDGRQVILCRNGEQIWVHLPKKNMLIVGDPAVPRFSTRPDSVSPVKIGHITLPVRAEQLALLPAAAKILTKPEKGGTSYVIQPGPLADKAGVKGEVTGWVAPGADYPTRITYVSGDTRAVVDITVRDASGVNEQTWLPQPDAEDKTERVALAHLTKFFQVALKSLGSKIPELGPATGERTLASVSGKGRLEIQDGTRVLFLEGTPEEMGRQHGELMKPWVGSVVDRILYGVGVGSSFDKGRWFFGEIEEAVRRTNPHVDPRHIAEMDALADAAGLEREEVRLSNFFPELFHCSGFAIHGQSTVGGKMYHGRVLDYLRGVGLEENAVVIVSKPSYGHAWVNLGYSGFTGSVTAMNEKHIAIGEMGGRGEGAWDGKPMAQLVREVMEQADNIDEAVDIMRKAPRTCEYYYVISDAVTGRACGLKTTPDIFEVVWSGQPHPQLADPVPDTVLLSGGDRYKELVRRVRTGFGKFDAPAALELMSRPVCMTSNIQSVLFEPGSLDFWVANADSNSVASEARFTKYNLRQLLDSKPPATAGR